MSSFVDLTPEDFVLRAIERLRIPPYKCIHSVFSGLDAAFRDYFPVLDLLTVTEQLADEGKITIRPVRGGMILYKSGDAPQGVSVTTVLTKILEEPN
jgi:hypothetical protein